MIGKNERLDLNRNNNGLLNDSRGDSTNSNGEAADFVGLIGANRPIFDDHEASLSARSLSCVLAFVESALLDTNEVMNPKEDIREGLSQVIRGCRLVSLRLNQFIEQDRASTIGADQLPDDHNN